MCISNLMSIVNLHFFIIHLPAGDIKIYHVFGTVSITTLGKNQVKASTEAVFLPEITGNCKGRHGRASYKILCLFINGSFSDDVS